jgi:alpha-tubulin suppressor-like RCC1 family protein
MAVEAVMVDGLSSITQVACSKNSTFALSNNGTLYSWGSNKDGVLGNSKSD